MIAFLFPGQGSQKVGMGADVFDNYQEHVVAASKILGYCIKTLCLEDPNNQLNQTQFTQPALYVVNALMYLDQVDKEGLKPDVVAGHSLGEYNALHAAGAFTFEEGLKLVKKRAELMGESNGGGMAAIMGLSAAELKALFQEDTFDGLDIASINSSEQVVISGPLHLISKVATYFEATNTQCYPLNVSAAFHSRYMKPAANSFFEQLESFNFSTLQIPVISNVFASPYDEVKPSEVLASQIYSSVRWEETIQYMMAFGVTSFLEVGPGFVLTNMQKNIVADPALKLNNNALQPNSLALDSGAETLVNEGQNKTMFNDVFQSVSNWNERYPIGTKLKLINSDDVFTSESTAMVLFGRKAVIYLKRKRGFFSLSDVSPIS